MPAIRTAQLARRAAIATLLGGALALATTSAASAHDGLIDSNPAADSTVTAEVTSIELEFSEDFLDLGTATTAFAVQVAGPNGKFYNTGCVALDGAIITTDAALGDSGTYEVTWQVVSSDGHPTSDTFTFDYEKPASVEAALGADNGMTCAGSAPVAEPTSEATTTDETPAPWVWVIVVAFVLLVVAAAIVVSIVVRRRRTTETTD